MSTRTIKVNDQLHAYLLENSLREPEVLKRLREETAALGGPSVMQISPEQGQLMALLIELTGASKMIEVGTFTGYSALVSALAMPPDGKMIACDVSDEWAAMGKRYWEEAGVADKIDLRIAPAIETLEALLSEGKANTFDMMFIDADKANYPNYYELGLKLLRPGGLILIDNVLWGGDVANPEVQDNQTNTIRALNVKLVKDERVTLSMIPIGDGLTLAKKR